MKNVAAALKMGVVSDLLKIHATKPPKRTKAKAKRKKKQLTGHDSTSQNIFLELKANV
jgi:response regulator of citrate/malate metabolism